MKTFNQLVTLAIGLAFLSCSDPNRKKSNVLVPADPVTKKQDSIVKTYKEVLQSEVYPVIKPKDRKKLTIINEFLSLVSNSSNSKKAFGKIQEIASKDTSDWDIGKLLIHQEFQDYLSANNIFVARIFDWKESSKGLIVYLDSVSIQLSKFTPGKKISKDFNSKPINETHGTIGKEDRGINVI